MLTRTNSAIVLRKIGGRFDACWSTTRAFAGVGTGGASPLVRLLGALLPLLLLVATVLAGAYALVHGHTSGAFALATAPAAADPKAIRDEIMAAFNEFKAANDQRLKEIEKSGDATAETTAKVDAINDRISELTKTVNRLSVAPSNGNGDDEEKKARNAKYRKAFLAYARSGDVRQLRELRASLNVTTDADGGYTVPDEFERTLIQKLENENVMRTLCNVIPSISGEKKIPVVTAHGAATWLDEEAAYQEGDETFGQALISAFKVGRLIKVSEELLQDSAFDIESYLAAEFARSIGAAEETAFVAGNGVGKPTGIVGSATQGKVGANGQTTSVTADDLIDLFHALKRPYRKQATWLLADPTAKAIRKLKDGNNDYLWQPGLVADKPDMLLGRPVEISDDVPAMAANAKSILFGAFKYYWIADRTGFSLQRLNELFAANGQVGFRGWKRTDGKLTLAETVVYYANSAA